MLQKIRNFLIVICRKRAKSSLMDKSVVKQLMNTFHADEYGHEANIELADLGYGWVHYGLLRQIKPRRVLCIGSRHGYIPAILAQACNDNGFGHVDFVDAGYGSDNDNHWTGIGLWKTQAGKNVFRNAGLGNHISVYVQTTIEFADKYPLNEYEYIYVDGDHSYKGVSRDYKLFWPMLRGGGMMVFHDIGVKEKKPEGIYGVWKLWKKIKLTKQTMEFSFSGSGLGVLQKGLKDNEKNKKYTLIF